MPRSDYEQIAYPALVCEAMELAKKVGFPLLPQGRLVGHKGPPSACIAQVGMLLRSLAASKPDGFIGEHGTGPGVGTSWMAAGLRGDARLVSAEIDIALASQVKELFRDHPVVEIRAGDWRTVMADDDPCDLLFMDAAPRDDLNPSCWDRIVELVKVGGQIVMDDLTPLDLWPSDWNDIVDPKREFASRNPRVVSAEVRTTAQTSALIVTRVK